MPIAAARGVRLTNGCRGERRRDFFSGIAAAPLKRARLNCRTNSHVKSGQFESQEEKRASTKYFSFRFVHVRRATKKCAVRETAFRTRTLPAARIGGQRHGPDPIKSAPPEKLDKNLASYEILCSVAEKLLTLPELVEVVREREGHTLTPRQLRYLEDEGVLDPVGRSAGGWRLYGPADVALVQLVVRLRRADVPLWQVKGLLAFKGVELRQALERDSRRVLVVEGARAEIVTKREADTRDVDVRVSLGDVARESSTSVYSVRRERPAEWAVPVAV